MFVRCFTINLMQMIILQSSLHLADMLYSGHPFIAEKFSGTVQITVKTLKNNFCISGTYIMDRVHNGHLLADQTTISPVFNGH